MQNNLTFLVYFIQTTAKIDFVKSQLDASRDAKDWWIGLHDLDNNRTFQWVDGTPLTTHDWYPQRPCHPASTRTCVRLAMSWDLQWNDGDCSQYIRFICEKNY